MKKSLLCNFVMQLIFLKLFIIGFTSLTFQPLCEYDTENHTEKSNYTEIPLKPCRKALQKIMMLKFSLLSH